MNRSEKLSHKPRGIIKWAPFNSLPEFTMKLKEKNSSKRGDTNDGKSNNRQS